MQWSATEYVRKCLFAKLGDIKNKPAIIINQSPPCPAAIKMDLVRVLEFNNVVVAFAMGKKEGKGNGQVG